MRKNRFFIGGVIICLVVGYLAYVGFGSSATYYLTISELKEKTDSIYGKNVRVRGQAALGSVEQEAGSLMLRFTIIDEGDSLPVVYQGIVPDAFKVGNDIIVEGHLNSEGVFQANSIITKCPSKYVPE